MRKICLFLLILCCTQILRAQTLYVPSQYGSIQSAINQATSDDIVIVSVGAYIENIDFKGKAITVQSTDPNDPNIVAATIINGSSPADPNFGSTVLFRSGEDANSVLAGFTITGGTGSWLAISWEHHPIYWNRCGGGVLCYNMSEPTITKNVFTANITGQGGGIYVYGDPVNPNDPVNPPVHIRPIITDNTFINNTATISHGFTPPNTTYANGDHGDGGAIVCFQGVDAVISGNLITGNHAYYYGGGVHLRQWSNALITENEIIDNNSLIGAGVHITYSSAPTIRNNLIEGNIASNLGGGGVYVYYLSQPLIERNTITNNTSPSGAGIAVFYSSAGKIRNNLIFNNKAGAGICVIGSYPTITCNTIAGNYKNGIESQTNGYPVITGNIITSNGTGYGIRVEPNSWPVIKYNDIWGNLAGTTGPAIPDQTGLNGNISADPLFLDIDANDYHLAQNSPCVNAGDPNFSTATNQTDYDGDIRLVGGRVDIGADEVKPAWNTTSNKDYDTIQQAIDDSNDNDVIAITAGTHTSTGNRDIEFEGKAITVQSIDPNDWEIVAATIIDCNGSSQNPHSGFYFDSGEDLNSIIAGITVIRSAGPAASAVLCNNSSPAIKNCIIKDNICDSGSGAGVCALDASSPAIINCFLSNNHARGSDSNGGAISFQNGSDGLVANCVLTANTAGNSGGAIAASSSSPEYINCTIIGNFAPAGGAISSSGQSHPNVASCIIRDNVAADGNQLAVINTGAAAEMTVSFSDVTGGPQQAKVDPGCTLNWGSGNIDIDPNFVNPGYWDQGNLSDPNDDLFVPGNYHLMPGSPCVDAGDTGSIPLLVSSDIDGEQRIFNAIVDMGADEMITNPFDIDEDGLVGLSELGTLADEWLLTQAQLQTDFNADGTVNLTDFALLSDQWLWTAGWYQ